MIALVAAGILGSCGHEDKSIKLNNPRNIRGVVSYKRSFGDLKEIVSCERYDVDSLTHSIPFLVPRAAALLDTLGINFLDSLESKGLNPNKIIVTSVLRTKDDVKKLRRTNGNASLNSCHFYGTTFDVSWKRFTKVEDPGGRPMQDVSADTLKLVLSEVLRDLRKAERCYVKYELKQGCFHITTR